MVSPRLKQVARRAASVGALVLVSLIGLVLGLRIAGATDRQVGPIETTVSVAPALHGGTLVEVPPLGTLQLHDHVGPAQLRVRTRQLEPAQAQQLLRDPAEVRRLPDVVTRDVRAAVVHVAVRAGITAVLGAAVLGALVYRRWRPVAVTGGIALVVVAGSGGAAALTFDKHALAEPRYSGLLADAPSLVGDARDIVTNFDRYADQLARLTENVARLYDTTSTLRSFRADPDTIRVLHVSDIHDNPAAFDVIRSLVDQFKVDAVIDSGDISDHGTRAEERFAAPAGTLGVPYVYVRGNHDSSETQRGMARLKNVVVLDRTMRTVAGLRIFGVGDPRFTPDKTRNEVGDDREVMQAFGEHARDLESSLGPLDIAVVHDPTAGVEMLGPAPLVLAGHWHRRGVEHEKGALMLVEGSTGGAGLHGLENEQPTPLECSVLYFDRATHVLQAYDDVTVGGLGTSTVSIDRHIVVPAPTASTG